MIGILNTLAGYGIIVILLYAGFLAEVSNLIGYIFGFLLSYYLNKKYTFKSENRHNNDLPKFLISMGIAYLLNFFTLIVLYRYMGINVYASQVIASIVYTAVGYFLSKIWVFDRVESKRRPTYIIEDEY